MLFNSIEFLVFLPVVFLLYWKALRSRQARNLLLIAASYLFYGWWDVRFLGLIFLTTVCSYLSGLGIGSARRLGVKRLLLWGNVLLNLGILGLFKYFNFFAASFASMMRAVGWEVDSVTLDLILPVGISFYTFQALSYSIDVYRGQLHPTRDFAAFTVFISFFPQLVAGPIERATNLLPQFLSPRKFDYPRALSGMKLILWGLFKKMVVADNAAREVNRIFGDIDGAGSLNLWVGAFLFTLQIYGDFSGYSDIAIGVARLFGVELMRNFRLPYFAKSIHDFWGRWHISLTSWFRDYVYIPLGGNRKGRLATARNVMIVFLTSGLWHGANLTFVAWGAYHGLLSLPHIFMKRTDRQGHTRTFPLYFRETLMMGVTFLLVLIGWILFRAATMGEAVEYIRLMFSGVASTHMMGKTALCFGAIMLGLEWLSRRHETPFSFERVSHRWVRWGVYLLVVMVIVAFSGDTEQFIYFQF